QTFEERSYVATRWMTTNVEGSYMSAVFQGFMRLFNYIDGNNEAGEKIPMTAPVAVEMHPSGGKTGISNISISFFVPAKGNPPKAKDPTIYASNRPAGVVYVRSFDGFAMESDWNENAQALKDDLQAAGISFNPLSLIAAGYDPPFRFINRHNEIWLYGP
ncbi:HEBP2 protein, partial [Amia calva]|nr:HEBP2 protein [Amia calva]